MTNSIPDLSLRSVAKIAGFGYLIIFITGIYSNFFVLESLVVPGDAVTTASNITISEGLFRSGIFSFILMVIADLVLAWALYLLLEPANKSLSLFAAWFRLVNATIFSIALYHLLGILNILTNPSYLATFQPARLPSQIMLSLDSFNSTWLIGLIFFGVHLLLLGYLIIKSGYIPGILGYLLVLAAAGYLIDSIANFMLPSYRNYETIFMLIVVVPGIIGELSFTFWLLFRGGKQRRQINTNP